MSNRLSNDEKFKLLEISTYQIFKYSKHLN